jgi:hypothetical protein
VSRVASQLDPFEGRSIQQFASLDLVVFLQDCSMIWSAHGEEVVLKRMEGILRNGYAREHTKGAPRFLVFPKALIQEYQHGRLS